MPRRRDPHHRPAEVAVPERGSSHEPETIRLDRHRGLLLRGEQPVALRPKTWAVLLHFAERPGAVVSNDGLLEAVWKDVAVTPDTVSKSIGELRAALGDDRRRPRFIETVTGRGYRFLVDLRAGSETAPAAAPLGSAVVGPADDAASAARPIVGREAELDLLAARLARAHAGERQIVFVAGPPGIGKTALVDAFLASPAVRNGAAAAWVGRATCFERHGQAEPLYPVYEALACLAQPPHVERVVGLMRRTAPMWLAQMPWLIGDAEAAALRRSLQGVKAERMPRELAALLDEATVDRTLVLVFEDLHWSDPATVDALTLLAQRPPAQRLLVIGTFRPGEAAARESRLALAVQRLRAHGQSVELSLRDLDEHAVGAYLAARFPGHAFPAAFAGMIHAHTKGHPLFLIAAIDHLRSRGWILETSPGWQLSAAPESLELGVGDDLRQMIDVLVQQRTPGERTLLEAASVAANEITTRVLSAAMEWEPATVERHCETLAREAHLLEAAGAVQWPDGTRARRYRFTHELYRRSVYEAIPDERRARLHQRVGEALEAAYGAQSQDVAPQLAMHFERGGDKARTLRYLTAAGLRARQRFASREAIAYFEAALALAMSLPAAAERDQRELEIRMGLGRVLADVRGFGAEPVRTNYERVCALCAGVGTPHDLFEAEYARWYLHLLRGDRREATTLAAALHDLARRLGTAEEGLVADSVLVRTALYDGRFTDAAAPMASLRATLAARGDAPARTCYGVDPVLAATLHYANILWCLGDVAEARATAQAGLAQAHASGNSLFVAAALGQTALVELFCRNSVAGGELAERAERLAAAEGFALWHGFAAALRGWALVQQGQVAVGCRTLEDALEVLRTTNTHLLVYYYAFLAEGHLRAGSPAAGLAAVEAGLAVAEARLTCGYDPELWRLHGELLLAPAGAPHGPGRERVESAAPARSNAWPAAERSLRRARDLARAAQAKSLELRAATSLARAWAGRDRRDEAAACLGEICAWFAGRPETPDLAEARALLGTLGAGR